MRYCQTHVFDGKAHVEDSFQIFDKIMDIPLTGSRLSTVRYAACSLQMATGRARTFVLPSTRDTNRPEPYSLNQLSRKPCFKQTRLLLSLQSLRIRQGYCTVQ